jgi:hypothetical protein
MGQAAWQLGKMPQRRPGSSEYFLNKQKSAPRRRDAEHLNLILR